MKKIIVITLLLSSLLSLSQEDYNSENYRVNLGDMRSKTFEKDSTANALVIYEFGNSYVDGNHYDLRTEAKYKIKILNREGFNNATITLYLYNNERASEKVKDIIANTYNEVNGEVIISKLDEKDIFKEKYNENYTLVKFTLPNVKEGSVITYSYTLVSPFMFNYKGWNFQSEIPKLYSEYKASIPGNWDYNIKLVGGQKLFANESELKKDCLSAGGGTASCFNARYVMKDIPAFIEEDYMTAKSNYLARIEYELKTFKSFDGIVDNYTKTWETVDKELKTDPNIGRQLSKSVDATELLTTEILNEPDALKRAIAIYNFVQDNYTWNEEYKIYKDVSVKDLIKNKSGNVSSINILLHNLLEEAAINVKPVLLSTRNNGFATQIFPVISDFNYLIVQVIIEDKTYYLDATDNYLSFGELPFRCLNSYGRLLDFKNGSEWVDIKPKNNSSVLFRTELSIDSNQNLKGIVEAKHTGYHGLSLRKSYYANKENYIKALENRFPYLEIFDYEVKSEDERSEDFVESYKIKYSTDNSGETIYLNPFFIKFFTENPFKLQERSYPIDFGYKDSYLYMFKLNLGDTYKIIEQPKDVVMQLPNNTGQLSLGTKVIGNSVNLLMKIDFKEPIYPPEYYPYLKEFIGRIVDAQKNTLLVLQKK